MSDRRVEVPDNTAVRVALWRAMHVQVDATPHVLEDVIGLKLAALDASWRDRPDMHPEGTKPFRASIIARARFIEDLVEQQSCIGVDQYVILGAGLDTFAQRRADLAAKLTVFEIDQPATQEWKRDRLIEFGMGIPQWLKFAPVNFEAGDDWMQHLKETGFDETKPAVVASTGVSMYISKDATAHTFFKVAKLAPGSTLAMSFMLPIHLVDEEIRVGVERAEKGARANGTPWISSYEPAEIVKMARDAGFKNSEHVSSGTLADRYFSGRSDGLRPPRSAEELLVATT